MCVLLFLSRIEWPFLPLSMNFLIRDLGPGSVEFFCPPHQVALSDQQSYKREKNRMELNRTGHRNVKWKLKYLISQHLKFELKMIMRSKWCLVRTVCNVHVRPCPRSKRALLDSLLLRTKSSDCFHTCTRTDRHNIIHTD